MRKTNAFVNVSLSEKQRIPLTKGLKGKLLQETDDIVFHNVMRFKCMGGYVGRQCMSVCIRLNGCVNKAQIITSKSISCRDTLKRLFSDGCTDTVITWQSTFLQLQLVNSPMCFFSTSYPLPLHAYLTHTVHIYRTHVPHVWL